MSIKQQNNHKIIPKSFPSSTQQLKAEIRSASDYTTQRTPKECEPVLGAKGKEASFPFFMNSTKYIRD